MTLEHHPGMTYYPFPPIPPSFPELSELTNKELEELGKNEDKMEEFLEKLPQTRQIQDDIDALMNINKELANENLEKQPCIENCKEGILKKLDELSALRGKYDEFTHQHQLLAEKYTPLSIQENLKTAALEAEEESDTVAEKFLAKEMAVGTFLQSYVEKRKLGHCRRVKEEKLHHQLMELQKAGF